jgi:predicted nucleic acid-binding protein
MYDAAYVALAEVFETTLVTADARIKKASGLRCNIDVLR